MCSGKSWRYARRACFVLVAALLCGCGANGQTPPLADTSLSLQDALAQVRNVPLPGMTPADAAQLRDSLSQSLSASGKSRFTSSVETAGVIDLTIQANVDGSAAFTWTYKNPGDLDQNSQVTISDLTALGANLGKNSSSADWYKAQVADGDGNGEVNISDLTSIGANLLHTLSSYRLESSPDGSAWSEAASIPFSAGDVPPGGGRMLFTYLLSNPVNGAHFRLVGSDGTSDSSPSNTVVYSAALPAVTGLTATQGSVAQKVTLSWDSFTGATQYAALRGTSKNGTYVEIGTPTAATIFDDTTAQPGTHYWYKIIASDGSGMISSPSAGAEGWAMDMPPAPANLAASDATFTDHVHLDWDAVSGATNYHVWRSDTQGSGHVEIGTSPTNSYDDATVADTAPKYYYVTAENAAGISVPGNEDAGSIGPSGSGLTLVITNPPAQGDGSSGDPYVVNVGENYGFTLTDSVDGDVTLSPNSLYQTSDPNATASNGNLSIGPGTGDFEFDGTYQSNQSNKVYFKMQAASALVILPHPIDPNWLGVPNFSDPDAGTSSNAYVMHNASFNPDNNNDGTYDDNFMLEAKENGNVVDNETLTWASFPPFVALDVNNTGTKGQFHANQFSVGYIFAQSVTEESNHLYVEVTLTP